MILLTKKKKASLRVVVIKRSKTIYYFYIFTICRKMNKLITINKRCKEFYDGAFDFKPLEIK